MSDERTLASSIGQTKPHSITFEVSEFFLDEAKRGEWSASVQFRFERRDDDSFDLVMRDAPQSMVLG